METKTSSGIATTSANSLLPIAKQIEKGNIIKSYYPSKVLGFIEVDGKREAVIQCCVKPLQWNTVESKKIVPIMLGTDFEISFVTVTIDALVHPLCVLPNCGGDPNTYFVVLPKRNWSRYFGDKIRSN